MAAFEDELLNGISKFEKIGMYPVRQINSAQGAWISVDGEEVLNLSANNYLGLANDPILKQGGLEALEVYGVGAGSARSIAGNMSIYQKLEETLAEFKQSEAAILLQSGFDANITVIPMLSGPDDIIFSDELNHISITDGISLSKAKSVKYKHLNWRDLDYKLHKYKKEAKKLIITDGVFGINGEIAPLPELVKVKDEHGALLIVDDAHGEGVLGDHGRGIVNQFGLQGKVEAEVGSLSKAFGVLGGYVATSKSIAEYLKRQSHPFLFSTPISPADAGAAMAAVRLLSNSDMRVKKLWENTEYFKKRVEELGFDTGYTETPIIPLIIGSEEKTYNLSRSLMKRKVFVRELVFPAVPRGTARLSIIISALHSKADLDYALEQLELAAIEVGFMQ